MNNNLLILAILNRVYHITSHHIISVSHCVMFCVRLNLYRPIGWDKLISMVLAYTKIKLLNWYSNIIYSAGIHLKSVHAQLKWHFGGSSPSSSSSLNSDMGQINPNICHKSNYHLHFIFILRFFRWRSAFFAFSFRSLSHSHSLSCNPSHGISARFGWLVREFLHFISMWFIKIQMNANFIIIRIKFGIEKTDGGEEEKMPHFIRFLLHFVFISCSKRRLDDYDWDDDDDDAGEKEYKMIWYWWNGRWVK